ncbi:MAG: hypothetical protein ACUVXJ_18950 [Phycisphaerae bacterium]
MTAINRILYPGAILSAVLLLVLLKLPHLLLAVSLASGQLNGKPIPAVNMSPSKLPAQTRVLPCGDLRLEVPTETSVQPQPPDESRGFLLRHNGMVCRVMTPRHQSADQEVEAMEWGEEFNRHGIDWQAAVCAKSARDFSFWMSSSQVESLRNQLEARLFLSLFAERIEVVRNENLCGLLLMWGLDDRPRMRLDYFTPDHQVSGVLLVALESTTPEAIDTTRAIVSSLRVEHPADKRVRVNESVAAATQRVPGRLPPASHR